MVVLEELCTVSIAGEASETAETTVPVLEDHLTETSHSVMIDGQTVDYTVTTGTMAMDTNLGQYEIFFTAYTKDGAEYTLYHLLTIRPVTCFICTSRLWNSSVQMRRNGFP